MHYYTLRDSQPARGSLNMVPGLEVWTWAIYLFILISEFIHTYIISDRAHAVPSPLTSRCNGRRVIGRSESRRTDPGKMRTFLAACAVHTHIHLHSVGRSLVGLACRCVRSVPSRRRSVHCRRQLSLAVYRVHAFFPLNASVRLPVCFKFTLNGSFPPRIGAEPRVRIGQLSCYIRIKRAVVP